MATDGKSGDKSEGSALREQLESALAENAKLNKRLVVNESGIDVSNPMVKLFVDSYQGEWDVESFTEKASEYGLIGSQDAEGDGDGKPAGDGEGGDEPPKQVKGQAAHGSQFDQIFNATGQGGNDLPKEEKGWKKARNPEEFMAQYDGRVSN